MGDVAMTAPVLAAMAANNPQVKMIMLTRDFYEPFFDGITNLTIHNIDLAEKHKGIDGVYRLYKELTASYKVDLVLDLNDKLYSRLLRLFFRFSGITSLHINKGRKGKKELTRKKNKIMKELRSSIARYQDVFVEAGFCVEVKSKLTPQERPIPMVIGPKHEKWIGVAPFAKHRGKMLPLSTIRKVIELIEANNHGVRVFIFGGGSAERMVAESIEAWFKSSFSIIGKLTLRQELDLIGNLDVMLSMDSSAMHMSSLMGTPAVSIWGATHPYAGFLGLGQSVDDVVSIDLPCRPCSVYGHKPCHKGTYECLTTITAPMVYDKIKKYL